jgi:anti-sigma B factor antagonist
VRCSGDLSSATAAILRQELAIPLPRDSSVLTLNLSGCDFLDGEGMITLLDAFKWLRREGHRLVLVTEAGALSRLLQVTGIDRVIPTFPTEAVAAQALRGGSRAASPASTPEPERTGERERDPGVDHILTAPAAAK